MPYQLFTYPNCPKCEALKSLLGSSGLPGSEYNLIRKEGKLKIRDYLDVINRDEKGGIILPTLIIEDEGEEARTVINRQEELADWLKSRG